MYFCLVYFCLYLFICLEKNVYICATQYSYHNIAMINVLLSELLFKAIILSKEISCVSNRTERVLIYAIKKYIKKYLCMRFHFQQTGMFERENRAHI